MLAGTSVASDMPRSSIWSIHMPSGAGSICQRNSRADPRLDLGLEVGAAGAVQRDRRLDRLGLRPAARHPVERHALTRHRAVGEARRPVQAVGDRRGVELARIGQHLRLTALLRHIQPAARPIRNDGRARSSRHPRPAAVASRRRNTRQASSCRDRRSGSEQLDDLFRAMQDRLTSPVAVCQARNASSMCMCGFERRGHPSPGFRRSRQRVRP